MEGVSFLAVSHPLPSRKQMPKQSDILSHEFQESEMDNPQKRRALALRVRPVRCPYCGAYASMNVNSWPIRYIIYSR